jgi:estrone sulfotransferase
MTDLDFKGAEVDLDIRYPFFEVRANWSPKLAKTIRKVVLGDDAPPGPDDAFAHDPAFPTSFEAVESLERPRFVKSHLHYSLLPQQLIDGSTKAKMIYVARNPKDTCVSFFHHSVLLDGYDGSLEEFVEAFITDNVYCAPFWSHLREFWEVRNRSDVLFLKFEDMKEDLPKVIRQTAAFLGKTLTEEKVDILADHLSFESMKNNPACSKEHLISVLQAIHGKKQPDKKFMRKGQVGSWKDELPPQLMARFDEWIEKNRITGLY